MKQLRYWLREKSFVAFVVGGILLLALAGSMIYLVKQKTSNLVAVDDSGQSGWGTNVSTELDENNQKDSKQEQTPSGSEFEANDVPFSDNDGSSVAIAFADELPQTGGGLNTVRTVTILALVYGGLYLGQFLMRRI